MELTMIRAGRIVNNRALWRAYCEGVDWLLREEAKDGEA